MSCDRQVTFHHQGHRLDATPMGDPRFRIAADNTSTPTPAKKAKPMIKPHTDQAKRLYRRSLDDQLVTGQISAAMHRRLIAEDVALPVPSVHYDAANFPNAGRLKDPYRS